MEKFAITDGSTLTALVNATDLKSAIGLLTRKLLREDGRTPNSEGKLITAENAQQSYREWAETMIENMQNDGYAAGTYTINMDDMVDNWSNRYWLISLKDGEKSWSQPITNSEQYQMLYDRLRPLITEEGFVIETTETPDDEN